MHRLDWLTSADETAEGLKQAAQDGGLLRRAPFELQRASVRAAELLHGSPLRRIRSSFSLHMDPIYDGVSITAASAHPAHGPVPAGKGDLMATKVASPKAAELARRRRNALPRLDQLACLIMAHPSCPLPIIGTNKLERDQACAKGRGESNSSARLVAFWSLRKVMACRKAAPPFRAAASLERVCASRP